MFVHGGYTSHQIQALNRCRISHRLLFLSDITLACGKFVDPLLLLPPSKDSVLQYESSYTFPTCKPSQEVGNSGKNSGGLPQEPRVFFTFPRANGYINPTGYGTGSTASTATDFSNAKETPSRPTSAPSTTQGSVHVGSIARGRRSMRSRIIAHPPM